MNYIHPKISIITVCKNSERTIEQTIQSVISQDYDNIEYIIIDGCSTDRTLDIIRRYENRITLWISEPDSGVYDAMNKGIAHATGDIIAFLNSDDWYTTGAVSYVANDISQSGALLSCYGVNLCCDGKIQAWKNELSDNPDNLRLTMCYCHQAVFAARMLFERYGVFNVNYRISADYDWMLRVYNHGVKINYKNHVIANYRLGGISASDSVVREEEARSVALLALEKLKEKKKIGHDAFFEWREKIVNHYDEIETEMVIKYALSDHLFENNAQAGEELKTVFDENQYSILGCGDYGRECKAFLQKAGCRITDMYDNDIAKRGKCIDGICIKSPDEIEKGKGKIIVCTKFYMDAIRTQLIQMGLEEGLDFVDYNMIRKKIGVVFKKYYS